MEGKGKRILALIGVVAIVAFIIAFVFSAFQKGGDSLYMFMMMFFCVVALPILIWIVMVCIKKMKENKEK